MARKDDFRGVNMHCVVCMQPIPQTRKWDSICCSPECTKDRKNYGRSRKDQTACRYCLKPSTPEERARFALWKKWEAEMMDSPDLAAKVKAKWEEKTLTDPDLAAKVLDRALLKEVQGLRLRLNVTAKPEEEEEEIEEKGESDGQDSHTTR